MIGGNSTEHPDSSGPYELKAAFAPLKLAELALRQIRIHSEIKKRKLSPTELQLEPLREQWSMIADLPLIVTQDGVVLDGHKRLAIATEKGMTHLRVLMITIPEDQVITRILGNANAQAWLKQFSRLEVAWSLAERIENDRTRHRPSGGRNEHSPKLSKAERLKVLEKIAKVAGASVGSARKVMEIVKRGIPELIEDLRFRKRSIHSGWKIARLNAADQKREIEKGLRKRFWHDLHKDLNAVKSRKRRSDLKAADCISIVLEMLRGSALWAKCEDLATTLLKALKEGDDDGLPKTATIESAGTL